jgi:hypothetical protein
VDAGTPGRCGRGVWLDAVGVLGLDRSDAAVLFELALLWGGDGVVQGGGGADPEAPEASMASQSLEEVLPGGAEAAVALADLVLLVVVHAHEAGVGVAAGGGGGGGGSPQCARLRALAAADEVSHLCACIGSPCLRQCVHGASIGVPARCGGGGRGEPVPRRAGAPQPLVVVVVVAPPQPGGGAACAAQRW